MNLKIWMKKRQKRKTDGQAASLKNQVDNNTKRAVLSMMTEKSQDRYEMASSLGINERTFRAAVRALRREGYPIVAESRGKGYRMGSKQEALITARELESRACDLLQTAAAMRRYDPDQLSFEEVEP